MTKPLYLVVVSGPGALGSQSDAMSSCTVGDVDGIALLIVMSTRKIASGCNNQSICANVATSESAPVRVVPWTKEAPTGTHSTPGVRLMAICERWAPASLT